MGTIYSFDSEHAIKYGTSEAVILHNFIFWIKHNKANKKNYHDGRYWTYNSVSAFEELFPFLSKSQIRTCIKNLESKGAIIKGAHNKLLYDKTSWYALTDEVYAESVDNAHLLNLANGSAKNDKCHLRKLTNGFAKIDKPIPDSKPYNKPNKKTYENKTSSIHNFEERTYSEDDYEKLFANNVRN